MTPRRDSTLASTERAWPAGRGSLPAAGPAALDVLKDDHFRRLAREIEARVGIKLPDSKKTMVEGRLRRRSKALGLASLDDYGRHLFDRGQWGTEFDAIVDCVTTNKTDFFREPEHFDILCDVVMPQMLASRGGQGGAPIKVWSAASSTGAEAYTLAMVLAALRDRHDFTFSVLGTDINTEVVQAARRAVYADEMRDPVPADMRRAYTMDSIDRQRREFRIVPELRRLVSFGQLNLMNETYDVPRDFSVIFCRNVLIYFGKEDQKAVVSRLVRHLRPRGFLFLGHSEATAGGDQPALRQVAPTVFQREA